MSIIKSKNWIRDVQFNLKEYLKISEILNYPAYQSFTEDDCEMLINEAIRLAKDKLYPVNRTGDKVGVHLKDGHVITPSEFKTAWKDLIENNWQALAINPEFGGGGLPYTIAMACNEYIQASNPTLFLFAGLSVGAGRLIESFGTTDLKEKFLTKMYSGEWTGTMCLTEPQAGSDLNLVSTKAQRDGDTFKITGNKIFITCGDHDLTKNIIHLVLARIDGAPQGTEGISLFVVPKFWINLDGSLETKSNVSTIGVEEKMGFHASPTCALSFNECRGYLVGTENKGMSQMFQLMNEARMLVGSVSLSISAQAYDHALTYAKERVQGAPITKPKSAAVPIVQHEDVRRMLMTMKSTTEGIRALIFKACSLVDISHHDLDQIKKDEAKDLLALYVPIVKSYASDRSWDICRDAIQVLGGYGFTREYPVEQLARESKINSIWEGTNYIQSADLLFRKVAMKGGSVVQKELTSLLSFAEKNKDHASLSNAFNLLAKNTEQIGKALMHFIELQTSGNIPKLAWCATRFLDSFAEVEISAKLLEHALIAERKLLENPSKDDRSFYEGKIASAQFYVNNILPQASARINSIIKGDSSGISLSELSF